MDSSAQIINEIPVVLCDCKNLESSNKIRGCKMESLSEIIPGIGDAIRIGKLSYQLGEMLANYFSEDNETENTSIVTWRKLKVFNKEYPYWQDNGFSFSDIMLIICTLGVYPMLLPIIVSISYCFTRAPIIANAEDIEVTDSQYKMLRSSNGKIGLCSYDMHGFFGKIHEKLLLPCKYKLQKGFRNSYIVENESGKFGLYNAELKMFVAKCEYDLIAIYSQNTYLYTKGDVISLMTEKGDRV